MVPRCWWCWELLLAIFEHHDSNEVGAILEECYLTQNGPIGYPVGPDLSFGAAGGLGCFRWEHRLVHVACSYCFVSDVIASIHQSGRSFLPASRYHRGNCLSRMNVVAQSSSCRTPRPVIWTRDLATCTPYQT